MGEFMLFVINCMPHFFFQSPNNPHSVTSTYSTQNQQVFSYPNITPGSLSGVSPSLPMGLFTSSANTPRGTPIPRWPTNIPVAPVTGTGNEEESTDYQMVSGFGNMNPDEGMLEGWYIAPNNSQTSDNDQLKVANF